MSPCTLTGTARVGSADTARPHSGAARFRPDGGLEGTALPSDTAEGLGEGTTLKKGGKKLANDKKAPSVGSVRGTMITSVSQRVTESTSQ